MDPEVMNDTPVDLVRQGERLMRIENDTMLQIAVQRPRKEQEVTKAALQELELNPEQAKSAYYSIPYKERIPGQPGQFKITKVIVRQIKTDPALEASIQRAVQMQKDTEAKTLELQLARAEATRKVAEATGIADANAKISASITDNLIRYKQAEAMKEAAKQGTVILMPMDTKPLINVGK